MSNLTFQKLWRISIGQYNEGVFSPLFIMTEHKFAADIRASAGETSSSETPPVTMIQLFNIGYERTSIVSGSPNLYIKIEAGYLFSGDTRNTFDSLPMVYLGFIHFSRTFQDGVDVITEVHCTPAQDKLARARINKEFNKGTFAKDIFKALAASADMPIVLNYKNKDKDKLKTSKTVEGATAGKLTEWCHRYKLHSYVEKGIIYVVDKEVSTKGEFIHEIPLTRIKGVAELSIDISQVLKESTTPSPDIELTTFLYPEINLRDVVIVEVPDYTTPPEVGKVNVVKQQFVITSYSHKLDSGSSSTWDTHITAKGEQSAS